MSQELLINTYLTEGDQIMEALNSNNYNQEESFVYGNFTDDCHGFQVIDQEFKEDIEAQKSLENKMQRLQSKPMSERHKKAFKKALKKGSHNRLQITAQKLADIWLDILFKESHASQEDMLERIPELFDSAVEYDENNKKREMAQAKSKDDQQRIFFKYRFRAMARNLARTIAKGDLIELCASDTFYSAEHPVIESFAEVSDKERASNAWLDDDADPVKDHYREPRSQSEFADKKLTHAHERQCSELCTRILSHLYARKNFRYFGKRLFRIVNRCNLSREEQSLVWATYRGQRYIAQQRLFKKDPAYKLVYEIYHGQHDGKSLYKLVRVHRLSQYQQDRVWSAWRKYKHQCAGLRK